MLPSLYLWHIFPDAMGTFPTGDGGFILTSNSEVPGGLGGASAIRFDAQAKITGAYRILSGTSTNCAGAVTPWGTWLSCEEEEDGRVWECDPTGAKAAVVRPAMGVFQHEAACVDPLGRRLYMTEDIGDSGLYRFTPASYPDLSAGLLEIAVVGGTGTVEWKQVPDPSAATTSTRKQVPEATTFARGEGMWFDNGVVYFATTSDDRVYAYHVANQELEVLYDGVALGEAAPLHDTDNLTVSAKSGELFVAEDADDLQVCVISPRGEVAPFAQITGAEHTESEVTGPVFDPSGQRLYFSSQRALAVGAIYEVSGPFTQQRPAAGPSAGAGGRRLKLRVLGKPSIESLLDRGLPVRVTVTESSGPVDVVVKLVARPGARSAGGRGGKVLATARLSGLRDTKKLRLRPPRGRTAAPPDRGT
jgi:secreted PhoX family phosphatase